MTTIKKTAKAERNFGDHASYIGCSARYGIYDSSKQVGSIIGTDLTYMSGHRDWIVYGYEGDNIRELKRFYGMSGNAFSRAKVWAMGNQWS